MWKKNLIFFTIASVFFLIYLFLLLQFRKSCETACDHQRITNVRPREGRLYFLLFLLSWFQFWFYHQLFRIFLALLLSLVPLNLSLLFTICFYLSLSGPFIFCISFSVLFQSAHASLFVYLLYGLFVSFQCERHTYRFHCKYMQTSLPLFFFNLIACTYSILFYFYMTIFYPLFFIVNVHIHSFFILSLLYLPYRVVSKDTLFPHHSVSCCLFYLVIPTPCKPCLLSLALCT